MSAKVQTADKKRRGRPARVPVLAPVRTEAERHVIVAQLARLWDVIDSPAGDGLVNALQRLSSLPAHEREKVAGVLSGARTTPWPMSAAPSDVVRWMLAHALRRGLALPGLQKRDLFVALAEPLAQYDDIAMVMGRSRDHHDIDTDGRRRRDQRKVMTAVSRLNKRRRAAGYGL